MNEKIQALLFFFSSVIILFRLLHFLVSIHV